MSVTEVFRLLTVFALVDITFAGTALVSANEPGDLVRSTSRPLRTSQPHKFLQLTHLTRPFYPFHNDASNNNDGD
jgi:hypothetical protein